MTLSPFCQSCIDLPTCEEIEEDDLETEVFDCDYRREK